MLPITFQFSQNSLQDYVDCPRRFQLRFVLMQPWPATVAEPARELELHMRLGADFHRLAHQHVLGLEPVLLASSVHDQTLARWWKAFLENPPSGLPEARRSEVMVTAPIRGRRLVAKFDLLAVDPDRRLVVVDWKTSPKRPSRAELGRRLQTRVYRFLAVEAGAAFNDGQLPAPEQVEMLYWYADSGGHTENLPYDLGQFEVDAEYLGSLITEICELDQTTWELTPDDRHCRFCNYRSLCERNVVPGFARDLEDDTDLLESDIDLELVPEIEF